MRAGEHVTPQVRLVRPLGAGGMGAVWVAEHLALKTQVAVKFILAGREHESDARERFSREAEAAAQVKSPHVTQIFDHGVTEDGYPFIVMELLEGEDLARHLQAHGRMGLREAAAIVTQVCKALGRAHAKGLIHRDVKPANIFLCDVGTEERFVKLLDFGVAKMLGGDPSTATKSGSVTGTPVYMAPEQLLGSKDVDHRADLWSVAVVAYELITGRRPVVEETAAAIALRLHKTGMPRPSEKMTDLSANSATALDEWFSIAWAIDPRNRYDSALAMAEDFENLVRVLYESQGVESTRRYYLPLDQLVASMEPTDLTVREVTGPGKSDVTLASGRLKSVTLASSSGSQRAAARASSSKVSARVKVIVPASETSPPAPHTETPISKEASQSHPPAVVEAPPRNKWLPIVGLGAAALIAIGLFLRTRTNDSGHASPPASNVPKTVEPTPSASVTTTAIVSPSATTPPLVSATVAVPSATATATTITASTATVKKTATPLTTPSASASVKKKLEDIE